MRVAFVTHQLPDGRTDHGYGLLKGRYAGGAEMSTEEMITQAPDDFQVEHFHPAAPLPDLSGYDRIVVGATERLSDSQMRYLASFRPVVWVRSLQSENASELLHAASMLVMPSPQMGDWHPWIRREFRVCPAPLDTNLIPRDVRKEDFALWAARDHPHKGEWNALAWGLESGHRVVALKNVPRDTVLEHMGRARWFIHLPNGPDPCPRTVIEAEIAGCELVLNKNVGRVPVSGADNVAGFVSTAAERFWGWVRNG